MAFLEYRPEANLYQYTSVEGFNGIISGKQLWLSDLRSVNDPRELIYGLGKIRPILDDLVKENAGSWDSAFMRRLLAQCYKSFENNEYFVCCFSPRGDQMPMWQNYGVGGEGIVVGFRPRSVFDMPGRIQRVNYIGAQDPEADLRKILFKLLQEVSIYQEYDLGMEAATFFSELLSICTSTKHVSWVHENEVRLVYSQTSNKETMAFTDFTTTLRPDGDEVKWQDPCVRASQLGEVKYIPFSFGKYSNRNFDSSGAIAEVIIGAKCALRAPEIEATLSSQGFRNFSVVHSECVWR